MKKILTKKNSLKESLPLMSLLIALNLILVSLVTYLPFTNIFIFFILPIPSLFTSLYIKNRYYPLYFIISLGLGLLVSLGDISFCLLNQLPSLITSFILGLCTKIKLNYYYIYFILSIITFLLNIASIYLINLIFNIDIINVICNLLNIELSNTLNIFIPSLIYLFSALETFILYLILIYEVKNIIKLNIYSKLNLYMILINLLFIFLSEIFNYYFLNLFYLFLFISLFNIVILFIINSKSLQNLVIFLILLSLTWIIYIALYKYYPLINSFILLLIFPLSYSLYLYILVIFNEFELPLLNDFYIPIKNLHNQKI